VFIGIEVFGIGDVGEFIIEVVLPNDVILKGTNLKVLEIEHILSAKPEIKSVFTTVGSSNEGMQSGGAPFVYQFIRSADQAVAVCQHCIQ
jgi:multidrug efflux pump subunit AcrB